MNVHSQDDDHALDSRPYIGLIKRFALLDRILALKLLGYD